MIRTTIFNQYFFEKEKQTNPNQPALPLTTRTRDPLSVVAENDQLVELQNRPGQEVRFNKYGEMFYEVTSPPQMLGSFYCGMSQTSRKFASILGSRSRKIYTQGTNQGGQKFGGGVKRYTPGATVDSPVYHTCNDPVSK